MRFFSFSHRSYRWMEIRQRAIEVGSVALLVVLVIGPPIGLAWLALFTDTFQVKAITIVDAREHTTEAVRALTAKTAGRNILFVETILLEQRLLRELSQVRDIHIVRKLPGTLKIIVLEKTPTLLLLSGGKYYFVDGDGIAYEEASLDRLPGTILPIIKNTDQGREVAVGTPAVDSEFVNFVSEIEEKLPEILAIHVAEIRIPSLAAREVHFLTDHNQLIRFDTTRPAAVQLNVLERLLEHTIAVEELPQVEYIDLRIPNRVYYRTRG